MKLLSFLALVLLVSACGGKLNDEQKAEVRALAQSSNRASSAPLMAREKKLAPQGQTPNGTAIVSDAETELMADDMNGCDIYYDTQGNLSGTPIEMNYLLTAKGDQCPIDLNFSFHFKASQTDVSGGFQMKYLVKDEEFKKLNDVTAADINFQLAGSVSQQGFEVKAGGEGRITSTKHGEVNVELEVDGSGSQQAMQGYVRLSYEFPEFTANLEIEADGEKVVYTINGEEISKKEWMEYVSNLSDFANGDNQVKSQGSSDEQKPPPTVPGVHPPAIPFLTK